jgi:TetR/AcrR family transcriptional regulator, regulator of biofilm formation and stress response
MSRLGGIVSATMPIRPDSHRADTLRRREALLAAAVEVVAERGVAGATHREIARRAGLPTSTTSYFFGSLDELVLEALRLFTEQTVAALDDARAALAAESKQPIELLDGLLDLLLAAPTQLTVAQFEAYLEISRRPELAGEVKRVLTAFERLAQDALRAAGAHDPAAGAKAVVALLDGFALHRIAWPHRRNQRQIIRDALLVLVLVQLMAPDERARRAAALGA